MIAPSQVDLTLPAHADSLTIVRQVLAGIGDALGWQDAFLSDVKLAVTEACANVVMHAYGSGGGEIDVQSSIADGKLVTRIRDLGVGIAPTLGRESPSGIGMALMVSIATSVEIRSDRALGTTIQLSFDLPASEPIAL